MATEKQKQAARSNLKKARAAQKKTATSLKKKAAKKKAAKKAPAKKKATGRLSTAAQNDLPESKFAFPEQRKEPLTDARHVRNAIARFDQVEDVSDRERAAAWKRIKAAAKKYDVEIEAGSWRELMRGGKTARR